MGFSNIFKANFASIGKQRQIEVAIQTRDNEKAEKLISESITSILWAGLTTNQIATFDAIHTEQEELLNRLLFRAFHSGWISNGVPNISSAIDEVLNAAHKVIKEHRSKMI